MRYKIILLPVMCLVLVVYAGANEIKVIGNDTVLIIPKAIKPPVIDGDLDPVWRCVSETYLTSFDNGAKPPDSKTDLFGSFRLMWDNNNLYGFFITHDDVFYDADSTSWTNDGWEIYFDADNSKTCTPDSVNDMQIRFEHKDVACTEIDGSGAWSASMNTAVFCQKNFSNGDAPIGYTLEFLIPLIDLKMDGLAPGAKVGFATQQNDNDGIGREHISKWWSVAGDQYPFLCGPSNFGTALLSYEIIDTVLLVNRIVNAPWIDGVLDDIWKYNSQLVSMNSYYNGSIPPDNADDLTGEFRLMWDNNNIYGFFVSQDDILHNADSTSWSNDSWEIYFDGDNSKGVTYDGVNDVQLRFEWQKDVAPYEIDVGGGVAAPAVVAAVKAEAELAQVDFADGTGWTLEFSIPFDAIQVPNTANTKFGFEVQQNDTDGAGRDHISKWWLQQGDNTWKNASVFGTAILYSPPIESVERLSSAITSYRLDQNYPNPFNPVTTIEYQVPKDGLVSIKIYDMLGREVKTLVEEYKGVGKYSVRFDAGNLTSGVYICRLVSQSTNGNRKDFYTDAKKMMVIK